MWPAEPIFADRVDAGRRLAAAVAELRLVDPVVLALPRGGVPVAAEVARALAAPFDLLMVRKIGAEGHPEYGLGAVVDGSDPQLVLSEDVVAKVRPDPRYVEAEAARQLSEIERRRRIYVGERPPLRLAGRTVVLVDDGIATGGTVRAALKALRKVGAGRIVLAVPVAPTDVVAQLRGECDDVVCLATPSPFIAVSPHYQHFDQVEDEQVVAAMQGAGAPAV